MIQTRIIATVGPASDSTGMLTELIGAGVNVFRLNFSHSTLEQHALVFDRIRQAAQRAGAIVAVMADLCGPKIRVDPVEDDAFVINRGDRIDIVAGHVVGNARRISTNRPEIVHEARPGQRVLIDDGNVVLRVTGTAPDRLTCTCEAGGRIGTRKGINLPDTELAMPALTAKDREDLAWAVAQGVDFIAMSFVRSADDLRELRALIPPEARGCHVIAKIETVQAITHIDEIIAAADAVLVARGDLGVEMDLARVPLLQKEITRKCQAAGKPVIIATQMLQSMVEQPTATRAEVSDVANAILDAADAVMLSAETSVGAYPLESVRMLVRIAEKTEAYAGREEPTTGLSSAEPFRSMATAVARGASLLARELEARLVAVWTDTGNTARLLSKCRLRMPVVGLSPDADVCRRMALYFGVAPIPFTRNERVLNMLREVDDLLLGRGLIREGDLIMVVAGTRLQQVGATSAILIHVAGSTADGMPRFT